MLRRRAAGGSGTFLLYLNEDTWVGEAGEQLAAEVALARKAGVPLLMVHENDPDKGSCEFATFFSTARRSQPPPERTSQPRCLTRACASSRQTPNDLIQAGLYSALALALYPGPASLVSCCFVARALSATKASRLEGAKASARRLAAPVKVAKGEVMRRSSHVVHVSSAHIARKSTAAASATVLNAAGKRKSIPLEEVPGTPPASDRPAPLDEQSAVVAPAEPSNITSTTDSPTFTTV